MNERINPNGHNACACLNRLGSLMSLLSRFEEAMRYHEREHTLTVAISGAESGDVSVLLLPLILQRDFL